MADFFRISKSFPAEILGIKRTQGTIFTQAINKFIVENCVGVRMVKLLFPLKPIASPFFLTARNDGKFNVLKRGIYTKDHTFRGGWSTRERHRIEIVVVG